MCNYQNKSLKSLLRKHCKGSKGSGMLTIEEMKRISKPLVGELAEICECGTDNFTFEVPHSTFVFDGEEIPAFPLIEVKWFERG